MIKTGDMVINARMLMVSLAKDGKERTVQVHRVLQVGILPILRG